MLVLVENNFYICWNWPEDFNGCDGYGIVYNSITKKYKKVKAFWGKKNWILISISEYLESEVTIEMKQCTEGKVYVRQNKIPTQCSGIMGNFVMNKKKVKAKYYGDN